MPVVQVRIFKCHENIFEIRQTPWTSKKHVLEIFVYSIGSIMNIGWQVIITITIYNKMNL